jgi:ubiquinone/menaquinone biosynthesis C-methylase UbiE
MPEETSDVRERFGARTAGYRASAVHAGGADLERLIALVAPSPSDRALDIATGAGHVAVALARAGAQVTASDLTPGMLRETAGNLAAHQVAALLVLADALDLPFPGESFNVVTARMAPHHFPDPEKFLAEVARVLRPGGRLGLEDQAAPAETEAAAVINRYEKLRDPSHHRQLPVAEWKSLAETAGLIVRHAEIFEKWVEFDWWTAMQNASPEVRQALSGLLAEGPAAARDWYRPEFREGGLIERFCIPHLILLAGKPDRSSPSLPE